MTGAELLKALQRLTAKQLDLPVLVEAGKGTGHFYDVEDDDDGVCLVFADESSIDRGSEPSDRPNAIAIRAIY